MKCPKCGRPSKEGSAFCIFCGTAITSTSISISVKLKPFLKKYFIHIICVVVVIGVVFYIVDDNNKRQKIKDDINNYYMQKAAIDELPKTTPKIEFNDISLRDSNSSYTVATGSAYNAGSRTVKYVMIKVSFKDKNGKVIDTDSTYAVGSEGLAPGESTKWRASVEKDWSITNVSVSITDFDYD